MSDLPAGDYELLSLVFWISWFGLLYLAWPRLASLGRRLLARTGPVRPVRLFIPPARMPWDRSAERGLKWGTGFFLAISVLELVIRRPQLERWSLPLLGLCVAALLLVRGWQRHVGTPADSGEILFPQVPDNTAIGLRLLKVQAALEQLRGSAVALERRGGAYAQVAAELRDFIDSVRGFLQAIRLEALDSALLRQAQPLLIRLEALAEAFDLLVRLADGEEAGRLSESVIEVLSSARAGFEALRGAQNQTLLHQTDTLIAVLRQLYRPVA